MKFESENRYNLSSNFLKEQTVLSLFSPEEQEEIRKKKLLISSIAKFIGKDFDMPVELNMPGRGWHWDFQENVIRVDPKDLLEKPIQYLRFVIAHEGGHRRISRTEFIPRKELKEPGFLILMNSIEDPRMNNFTAEAYPVFDEDMKFFYEQSQLEEEIQNTAKKQHTALPRFAVASLEYIKQWFNEVQHKPLTLSPDLPEDVRDVLEKTLEKARESWSYYPSKTEADTDDLLISSYAKKSYLINRKSIWPEFKKLVEKDISDAKLKNMIENLNNLNKKEEQQPRDGRVPTPFDEETMSDRENSVDEDPSKEPDQPLPSDGEREDAKLPADLENNLTEDEAKELQDFIEESEKASAEDSAQPDVDELSPNLKSKLEEHFEKLSEEEKEEIREIAVQIIQEFEKILLDKLREQFRDESADSEEINREEEVEDYYDDRDDYDDSDVYDDDRDSDDLKDYEPYETIQLGNLEQQRNESVYKEYRKEVLPIIDKLEDDLRDVFVKRRSEKWESGFRSGKRLNIKRRIQEKAKGVTTIESKAWERRNAPSEQDYAISLLVDLSGSMQGEKIQETFKAVIVLAEVLNKLSIRTEVLGFNDHLYLFQEFDEAFSKSQREKLVVALSAVGDRRHASYNDDGWAITEASKRLAHQLQNQKFLIVLSDGEPVPSDQHAGDEFDVKKVVQAVSDHTDQKVIGLGIGPDTQHVEMYYPNNIANVSVEEMSTKLADLLREVVENYDQF